MQEHAQDIIVLTRNAWQTPVDRCGGPVDTRRRPSSGHLPAAAQRQAEGRREGLRHWTAPQPA